MRDVTKTKPSHHQRASGTKPAATGKVEGPGTFEGQSLAKEVAAAALSPDAKAKLVREIVDYEATHGKCTQTFLKKLRKQLRPA
jgi:hypothetical protein